MSTPILLAGMQICVLLFADDTTLFSTSWGDCEALFQRYLKYTSDNGLIVNMSKSFGMAFRADNRRAKIDERGVLHTRGFRSQWHARSLSHNGKTIGFVEKFKYLGLVFHSDGSLVHMVQAALAAGRRALGMLQGSLMSLGYIPYRYTLILLDALVVSVATYGCELWSEVPRRPEFTTAHDVFYRECLRKELGLSKNCNIELLHLFTGRPPLSLQMWRRRVAFFLRVLNSPIDGIASRALVELARIEDTHRVKLWLHDTVRLIQYSDPTFRLVERRTGRGVRTLSITGTNHPQRYVYPKLPGSGWFRWWTPRSAGDPRFAEVGKFSHAMAQEILGPIRRQFWDDAYFKLAHVSLDRSDSKLYMAALVLAYSPYSFREILSQPSTRLHRQSLARLLAGDLMIARITKNWYAREARIAEHPDSCIDCHAELGQSFQESEAHLLFECVTTRHLHQKFLQVVKFEHTATAEEKLRIVLSSDILDVWRIFGEVAYRIWCRPRQAWRRAHIRTEWNHTAHDE